MTNQDVCQIDGNQFERITLDEGKIPSSIPVVGANGNQINVDENISFVINLRSDEVKLLSVFPHNFVQNLFSTDLMDREMGLIQITDLVVNHVKEAHDLCCDDIKVSSLLRIFHKFLEDPSDLIFKKIFDLLRNLFSNMSVKDPESLRALQFGFYSFLKRLVRFAGGNLLSTTSSIWKASHLDSVDSNFDVADILRDDLRANLSQEIICNIAYGHGGIFKLGENTNFSSECLAFGGIPYLARFILTSSHFHQTHLIGRLKTLISLLEIESKCKDSLSEKQLISALIFSRHNIYKKLEFDEKSLLKNFPHNVDWNFVKEVYLKVNLHAQKLSRSLFQQTCKRLLSHCSEYQTNVVGLVQGEINQLDPDLRSQFERELTDYLDVNYRYVPEVPIRRTRNNNEAVNGTSMKFLPDNEPAYDPVALTMIQSIENLEETKNDGTKSKNDYAQILNLHNQGDSAEAEITYLRNALKSSGKEVQSRNLTNIPWISKGLSDETSSYQENEGWIKGSILGNGAYGICYKARDKRTGVFMAVKRIDLRNMAFKIAQKPKGPLDTEETKKIVDAEIEVMRKLDHKNILPLFGANFNQETCSVDIFMEWMAGGSISSMLQQFGPCNEVQTIMYTMQIASGIKCLHENGIIHRDLKGANILIDETGHILRISDFGTHAILPNMESVDGQFKGQMFGTIPFMAPEVLRSKPYGRACDIWSIGCCIIEMITSKPPWNSKHITNNMALAFHIQKNNYSPPRPEDISSELRTLLDSCLQVNPVHRPLAKELLELSVFVKFRGCE